MDGAALAQLRQLKTRSDELTRIADRIEGLVNRAEGVLAEIREASVRRGPGRPRKAEITGGE